MKIKSIKVIAKLILVIITFFFSGCLKCPDDYNTNIPNNTKNAPQLYAVLNENYVVHLNWTFDSNNSHSYKIERKKASEEYILIDSSSINNYEDSILIPTYYTYRIFAYDHSKNISDFSNEVVIAVP